MYAEIHIRRNAKCVCVASPQSIGRGSTTVSLSVLSEGSVRGGGREYGFSYRISLKFNIRGSSLPFRVFLGHSTSQITESSATAIIRNSAQFTM